MNFLKKTIKIISILLLTILIFFLLISLKNNPHSKTENEQIPAETSQPAAKVHIMDYNIRCLAPSDLNTKSWSYRADLVASGIKKDAPGIIGFQEVTKSQYEFLCDNLNQYDSIIMYRDTAVNSEGCPIFYQTDLYTLIDSGSFWLSETPDKMSKNWNSSQYRVCSYVILKDNASEKEFAVFNTHLDHASNAAKINGIKLIMSKISEYGTLPIVLMGDFNSNEDSKTYEIATETLLDTKYQTPNTMTSCTYQNWGKSLNRKCIDYILISDTGFTVNSYKVITDTYNGVYASDHFPVSVSLTLSGSE